ncbi:MAG TPA: H-NS histone family protein [Burkholderiaceae bacterium]|jgi:DNA-binding protein H-NS|nr:H-NS histone family protein [Burkholderiaceae bacterium]
MSTYQELLSQKAALEKQRADLEQKIEEARRAERSGVISQIKALMQQHGLSLADLGGTKSGPGKSGKERSGGKVAPKYRNPVTGDTWTGRGLQPKWVQAALASGKTLQDFAI